MDFETIYLNIIEFENNQQQEKWIKKMVSVGTCHKRGWMTSFHFVSEISSISRYYYIHFDSSKQPFTYSLLLCAAVCIGTLFTYCLRFECGWTVKMREFVQQVISRNHSRFQQRWIRFLVTTFLSRIKYCIINRRVS